MVTRLLLFKAFFFHSYIVFFIWTLSLTKLTVLWCLRCIPNDKCSVFVYSIFIIDTSESQCWWWKLSPPLTQWSYMWWTEVYVCFSHLDRGGWGWEDCGCQVQNLWLWFCYCFQFFSHWVGERQIRKQKLSHFLVLMIWCKCLSSYYFFYLHCDLVIFPDKTIKSKNPHSMYRLMKPSR